MSNMRNNNNNNNTTNNFVSQILDIISYNSLTSCCQVHYTNVVVSDKNDEEEEVKVKDMNNDETNSLDDDGNDVD